MAAYVVGTGATRGGDRRRKVLMSAILRAVEVRLPRRGREWMLAAGTIPAATAVLIAFARLPWVRPERGNVTIAYFLLYAIAAGLVSVPIVRTRLESWLTQWQRLYPTVPPSAEL